MQGIVKKTMGAVVTAEQKVYYLHGDSTFDGAEHNEWVEFTGDENGKACIQCDRTQETPIQEELLLEEEE